MPKISQRAKLTLSTQDLKELKKTSQALSLPNRKVLRARILLLYYEGNSIKAICQRCHVTHSTVYKWIDKALALGWRAALEDADRSPRPSIITEEDKAWVVHIACSAPKNLGLAAEIWSYSQLAEYVRKHAEASGHPSLLRVSKSTVHRILTTHHLRPHKIKYDLEKRDPEFEKKCEKFCWFTKKWKFGTKQKRKKKTK